MFVLLRFLLPESSGPGRAEDLLVLRDIFKTLAQSSPVKSVQLVLSVDKAESILCSSVFSRSFVGMVGRGRGTH